MKMFVTSILLLLAALPAVAQDPQASLNSQVTWLFDTKIGSQPEFGSRFSTAMVGFAVEQPFWERFEVQGNLTLLPDVSTAPSNGHAFGISGTGIGWINERVGVTATVEHNWLWIPQADKSVWNPSFGAVIRENLFRPGRLYASYLFPTGCSTAGPNCLSPSDRTQGMRVTQEFRVFPHFRLGFQTGIFHYCGEMSGVDGNQRTCHWGLADIFVLRFEVHSTGKVEPY
jgi:hypothetical protein